MSPPGKTLLRAMAILVLGLLLLPYALTPLYALVRPVSTPMLWRWVRGERVQRKGGVEEPLTRAQVVDKYRSLTAQVMPAAATDRN